MAEGSIVRLTLKDFMTFDDVTFRPGEKLNLVIGPNGSGKSSLSCAMVLGLAGKTKILGRAPEVGQFVKRGKKQAEIEIELFKKNNNNIVIRRSMTLDNKTSWHLNDETVSQKEIEDLMKSLQIQVDNLCQFLPQDRVHDFAKMNKQELLDNTQKSVGSPKLYEMFNELKNNMKKGGNHEKETQKIKDQILKSEDSVAKLQNEIEKVKRKRKMLDNVENLKRKKAWLLYDEKKERVEFLNKKTGDKLQHYKKKEKAFEPITMEIEKAEQCFSYCENQMGRLNTSARMDCGETRKILQGVHELHKRIASVKSNLKQTIEADSRVTVEMSSLQNELDRVENCIGTVDSEETNARLLEVEEKLAVATRERARFANEQEEKRHNLENIKNELRAVKNRIELVKNVQIKKIHLLESIDKDAFKVRQFVQENRHLFIGEVYGPIFVELDVPTSHAKYLEARIPHSEKISFLCEKAADVTKMIQLCRSERKLCFNVFAAPPDRGPIRDMYKPTIHISQLRNLGFNSYLLDYVEGPETVLRYLCHTFKIHNIPVGSDAVLDIRNTKQIEDLNINLYFSETQCINVSVSRYSHAKRKKAIPLRQPYLFIHDGKADPKLEQRAQQLMENLNERQRILNETSSRRKEWEDRYNELFSDRNALRKSQETVKHMLSKKDNIRREIYRLEKGRINRELEEQKAYESIKVIFGKFITRLCSVVDKAEASQEKMIKNALLGKKSERLQDDIAAKKEAAKEASQELNTLKTELADYKQKCLVLEKDADIARKEALATTDNLSPDNGEFRKRFAKAFSDLPETGDEIQQLIINFQARADCLGVNEQAIVQYEKLKTDIVRLQAELKEKTDEFNVLKTRTDLLKTRWLGELEQLVATINKSFSAVFRRMGCEGEVALTNNGNEDDILKYGLTIRVKFRQEDELQELDIFRQSGGERAVTIGIYMLSLQELTHVPFRCLDEINQGMDEQNERRVFKTLVETVKKNSVSQYFLLTPKLLTGLDYTHEVYVHVIFNGRGALSDKKWMKVNQMLADKRNKRKYESESD